jgi:hypothetical protein
VPFGLPICMLNVPFLEKKHSSVNKILLQSCDLLHVAVTIHRTALSRDDLQARDFVHAYNDKHAVDYLLESAVLCF